MVDRWITEWAKHAFFPHVSSFTASRLHPARWCSEVDRGVAVFLVHFHFRLLRVGYAFMAERLPIYEIESAIVASVREHGRVIISAPTGSGKSTQVPQMLLEHGLLGNGQVVVLQPRRLATRLLAARVAWERKVTLGGEVGYQIRLENMSGPETRIRFVTEGVLLR